MFYINLLATSLLLGKILNKVKAKRSVKSVCCAKTPLEAPLQSPSASCGTRVVDPLHTCVVFVEGASGAPANNGELHVTVSDPEGQCVASSQNVANTIQLLRLNSPRHCSSKKAILLQKPMLSYSPIS